MFSPQSVGWFVSRTGDWAKEEPIKSWCKFGNFKLLLAEVCTLLSAILALAVFS